jgi:hypothetical protein
MLPAMRRVAGQEPRFVDTIGAGGVQPQPGRRDLLPVQLAPQVAVAAGAQGRAKAPEDVGGHVQVGEQALALEQATD